MATRRDAETIGLLYKALVSQRAATVPELARRLGVPYGPPLLEALGIADDPRTRWAEVEGLIDGLQQALDRARGHDATWEEMSTGERADWLRTAQAGSVPEPVVVEPDAA